MATLLEKINQAKTNTENGKKLIANAITSKGVETPIDSTYQVMADNISAITSGGNSEIVGQKTITLPLDEDMGDMETCFKSNYRVSNIKTNTDGFSSCYGLDYSLDENRMAICGRMGLKIFDKDQDGNYTIPIDCDINPSSSIGDYLVSFSPTKDYLVLLKISGSTVPFLIYKYTDGSYKKLPNPEFSDSGYGKKIIWLDNNTFICNISSTSRFLIYTYDDSINGFKTVEHNLEVGSLYKYSALDFIISNGYLIICDMFNGLKFFKMGDNYTFTVESFTNSSNAIYYLIDLGLENKFIMLYSIDVYLMDIDFNAKTITKTRMSWSGEYINNDSESSIAISTTNKMILIGNGLFTYNLENNKVTKLLHPLAEMGYKITSQICQNKFINSDKVLSFTNTDAPYFYSTTFEPSIKKGNNKIGSRETLGYLPQGGTAGQTKSMVVLFEK